MSTTLSLAARKARLSGLLDNIGATAFAKFYTGAPPALPDDAVTTQVLLGSIPLASPAGVVSFNAALATLTLTVPRVSPAVASGTIGWVRVVNTAGEGLLDLTVGLTGSGMPVIVNVQEIFANGELQLVSCVLAE